MLDETNVVVLAKREIEDPKSNGMVAITILESAMNEYEEAIKDGKVAEVVEYQDPKAGMLE